MLACLLCAKTDVQAQYHIVQDSCVVGRHNLFLPCRLERKMSNHTALLHFMIFVLLQNEDQTLLYGILVLCEESARQAVALPRVPFSCFVSEVHAFGGYLHFCCTALLYLISVFHTTRISGLLRGMLRA